MSMIYTGIGSRETPQDVLHQMFAVAQGLAEKGWILRSGAAPGADEWFEKGCDASHGQKEIYLPWKNFQKNKSVFYNVSQEAVDVAESVWDKTRTSPFKYLKRPVKLLMGRNAYQIAGRTLDNHSDVVVCWTPDGCIDAAERRPKTGGTGQAIAHASYLGIPVFNLQREYALDELMEFIEGKNNA